MRGLEDVLCARVTASQAPTIDRRTDPRRGVAARVGLVVAGTGIVSAAIDRRALATSAPDVPLAVGFGLFLAIILIATFRRPVIGSTWIAFGSFALVYILAATQLASSIEGMTSYILFALGATLVTAPHLRPLMVAAFAMWTAALWVYGPTAQLDELPAAVRIGAVFALAFTVFVIADPRRVHPSDRLRRAGYGVLAIACVSGSIARHLVVSSTGIVAPGEFLSLIVAIALPALAYARMPERTRGSIATSLALLAFVFTCVALIVGKPYHVDAVVAPHRAAQLLLAGQDPYLTFDLPQALAQFHLDPELATHLLNGEVVHTYNYPAVSFLVVAPFIAIGLDDIRWIYVLEVMVMAVLALVQLKPAWRPFALATIVGNGIVARQWILAGIDPTWALLVMAAWIVRRHRWWPAVLIGLAIADRQPAWFVAPFFFLAVAQDVGWREAGRRAGVAVAVAVAVNLPFIIPAPERAIGGILAPLLAPLVSDGVGLMRYGVAGMIPLLPREAYTLIAVSVLVLLLVVLWRRPQVLAGAPLAWPFLPLYFAWRSLQNYFAAAPLFALVADEELEDDTGKVPPRE
jgi:uncharacterized membrane protein